MEHSAFVEIIASRDVKKTTNLYLACMTVFYKKGTVHAYKG